MSELVVYSLISIAGVFVSSISQIMLKKSAEKKYDSKLKEYLNPLVIIAYGLFFSCTLVSLYTLKVVPLSMSPVLEASGYIFVAVLSFFCCGERLTKKQIAGMVVILTGLAVYAMGE